MRQGPAAETQLQLRAVVDCQQRLHQQHTVVGQYVVRVLPEREARAPRVARCAPTKCAYTIYLNKRFSKYTSKGIWRRSEESTAAAR